MAVGLVASFSEENDEITVTSVRIRELGDADQVIRQLSDAREAMRAWREDLVFIPDSFAVLRYVGGQRWRVTEDSNFIAEFVADGQEHALDIARSTMEAYERHFA